MRLTSIKNKTGKNMLFFQPKFHEKKCGFVHRKKIARKMGVKKIARILTLKLFDASLTSNIVVGYSFDIKKNIWRVWSMAGHPFHSMAGHFSKKCSKFCQKMPKNRSWVHFLRKNGIPCWCNTKKIIKNDFICLY